MFSLPEAIFFLSEFSLTRAFTIHRAAEEGRGYLFDSFIPLLLAPETHIDRAITAESLPQHRHYLAAELSTETFGFRAQVSNH